ncbi:MAG TPA: 30S ribosome-binding factor RbfA, partial [Bryobacteraceae bacterium]|nr:30S ribosome-binding factor RbfA [Bryobacteraceae bacterium]
AVQEELAEIVGFELEDPRLLEVAVTEVHVSSDGRYAQVKVALSGDERQQRDSLAALDHARHYLRHELASRLGLRHVPELHFEQDRNPDADNRIDLLLKRAKKSRGKSENHP